MNVLFALSLPALLLAADTGRDASLEDFRVVLQGRRVEASFRLANGFSDEVVERIQTGLPTGFDFQFRLLKDYKRWWDRGIDSSEFQVVATYNAVTREYLVNYKQNGKLIDSRVVNELVELRKAMTEFDQILLFSLGEAQGRRRLLVRARVRLGSRTLFRIIPIDITTDWVESRKFRPPGAER